jgi:hypothetical protein
MKRKYDKRFIVKKEKVKNRGHAGSHWQYYLYDTERDQSVSSTNPFKSDVEKLAKDMNHYVEMKKLSKIIEEA